MRRIAGGAFTIFLMGATLAVVATACKQLTPQEKTAQLRSRFVANLNGWIVREPPAPEATVAEGETDGEMTEADATEGDMEAEVGEAVMVEMEEAPAVAQTRDILLDIEIYHTNDETMAGITVEVTHADEGQREKAHHLVWLDTAGIVKGQHIQVNHVLEGVDFMPGDMFHVEVRYPVPAAERGDYREFQGGN